MSKIVTLKEAILIALEQEEKVLTYMEVLKVIMKNSLYDFKDGRTPKATVSAQLGTFIRKNDSRVKRIKKKNGYVYYLAKFESNIDMSDISDEAELNLGEKKNIKNGNVYQERDLHILLSSYLNNEGVFSKTIYHEKSNGKDKQQKWVHPDVVGVKFSDINEKNAKALLRVTNQSNAYKITSYEIKRTINNDYELKEGYFQAVSNSSWANYGYLVAFEVNSSLINEIERLNQSFGIGFIELKANPFESQVLFPSKHHDIDFKTIEKLCRINEEFNQFIHKIEKTLTAPEGYLSAIVSELKNYSDTVMVNDSEIEQYCHDRNIPYNLDTL